MRELPKGWEWQKIGQISRLVNGKAFKPTEWKTSGVPIVRIQNLNNENSEFNYFDGKIENKYYIENGELLFAWSGTPGTSFGAHIWMGGRAVLNQHIFKMMIDESKFDKKYLMYTINHYIYQFINQAHGSSGLAHITKERFEATEILIPPLDTQKKIAEMLDGVKEIENLRKQAVKETVKLFDVLSNKAYSGELFI